jgi:hypothetical protein
MHVGATLGVLAMNFRPFLHHVGIVQPNESEALEQISLLSLEEEYQGFVPQWSALCIFTKARHGSQIEFVVPNGVRSPDLTRASAASIISPFKFATSTRLH